VTRNRRQARTVGAVGFLLAAYAGWGISLYLLGVILGSQVAQLYSLSAP